MRIVAKSAPIIINIKGVILYVNGIIEYLRLGLISQARHLPAIVEQSDIISVGVENCFGSSIVKNGEDIFILEITDKAKRMV